MNSHTPPGQPVQSLPSISLHQISKTFGDFRAVDAVSLEIQRGEFFSLLGPSGCGKTTLLRMIAGFELPTGGTLLIHGKDATHLPPYRRPVNMVFQHYALFPHLSVARNVAFGLAYKDVPKREYPDRVAKALALVRLSGLEKRLPNELSGGQKQRVALARALVLEPAVLLLDEPLGALDQKLRKEMQVELKNLQRSLGITFVFVTHDQEEALTMSDRIAVMNAGVVEQCDASNRVFEYPGTPFVAQFMGADNFFTAKVTGTADGEVLVRSDAGLDTRLPMRAGSYEVGETVRFIVRPEKLELRATPGGENGRACIGAFVEQRIYQGISTQWIARGPGNERLTIYQQNTSPDQPPIAPGHAAFVCWNPRHAVIVRDPAKRGYPLKGDKYIYPLKGDKYI